MTLPITGERTIPGVPAENYWFRRHEAAYLAAARLCGGARVLDAGCGEGYGAAVARGAGVAQIVALDYDAATIEHAHLAYALPAVRANLVAMPFRLATFDVVLSLQTIEHLWNQPAFLSECARVLRPGGWLVLTTPNRLTFPPGDLFHARELDADGLLALVAEAGLTTETVLGVHHGLLFDDYRGDVVADQLATEPEAWPSELTALVTRVTAQDFTLSSNGLAECLDLYLVAGHP
ncbi:MAG TPA: class I SAM-dependent methyltransferase [Jiangellaceae bacterium]|nr:class I SAM-dependent methyltransferase [Jiangellaceae bacterium]